MGKPIINDIALTQEKIRNNFRHAKKFSLGWHLSKQTKVSSTLQSKSPRQLRQELDKAKASIGLFVDLLRQNEDERRWGLGSECKAVADRLEGLVQSHSTPDKYRVAVVGRFKAGKSSFVNELLGQRLAGEDTSPETAAVTIFNNGPNTIAKIKLINAERWSEIKALYERDPTDPEAQVVSQFEIRRG